MATYYVDGTRPDDSGAGTSEGAAKKTLSAGFALLSAAGDILYIKSSATYTLTSTITLNLVSTAAPFYIIGYASTPGDDGTKPTITSATNSVALFTFGASNPRGYYFRNISFSHTAGTRGDCFVANASNVDLLHVDKCVLDGFRYGFYGAYVDIYSIACIYLSNSEIKNCTSHGIYNNGSLLLDSCWIHDNTGDGIRIPDSVSTGTPVSYVQAYNCIIESNSIGINDLMNQNVNPPMTRVSRLNVRNCDIINNSSHGISSSGTSSQITVSLVNNIIYGNGGYGVTFDHAPTLLFAANNAYGSNTSGNRNNYSAESGAVSLSGNPFTNSGSNDFTLDNTSGEGAACRAAGFTTSVIGTAYQDIGALQHQDAGGGGGLAANPVRGFIG